MTDPTRTPLTENYRLIDALEAAHMWALNGQHHTAPYWRNCEFFPCNAYDAIETAAATAERARIAAALPEALATPSLMLGRRLIDTILENPAVHAILEPAP